MGFLSATRPFKFPLFAEQHFLSEEEQKQVEVLFSQLFPGDHAKGVPGATDAKAARFVSQLLALEEQEFHKIVDWRKDYKDGLRILDDACKNQHNKRLSALSPEEAKTVLTRLEEGALEGLPMCFDQRGFFLMLLEHCIKGCFADPRWGGNENGIMWRWLGWVQPPEDISFEND